MTSPEHIVTMTSAIKQAIKTMGDRFGSTEEEVARVIQELKSSLQIPALTKELPVGTQNL